MIKSKPLELSTDNPSVNDAWVSKTRIKNAMHDLQAFGEKLCLLTKKKRSKLPVSELMQAAFEEYDRIKSNEAKRRHIQYVGKLMRNEEVGKLQRYMDFLDPCSESQGHINRQADAWRSRLLDANDKRALTDFIQHFPGIDAQLLRQLCRNSLIEASRAMHEEQAQMGILACQSKSGKKLFQLIRETLIKNFTDPEL